MPPKRLWTQEQKEDIVKRYLEGAAPSIIKKIYQCREEYIANILIEAGVYDRTRNLFKLSPEQQRKVCEMYKTGHYNLKIIAEKFNCCSETIKNILIKNQIPIVSYKVRHTNIDLVENYFENIDTECKAYFLGFLFADGSVYKNQLALEVHIRDIEIVNKLKEELCSNSKISYRKRENTEMVTIRISSEKIISDLAKYGIVPNKTKTVRHLPQIPQEYLRHFLRGLVDGDGWLTIDKNNRLHLGYVTYFKSVAKDFQNYCNSLITNPNKAKITEKSKTKHSGYVSQFFAQQQVKQLVTVLYKDSNIFLTRKYSLAEGLFESNNDEDIV